MLINQTAASVSFSKTRAYYERDMSYKSSNKLHLAPGSSYHSVAYVAPGHESRAASPVKFARLMNASKTMGGGRIGSKVEGTSLDRGMVLYNSKTRANNCGELSAVAAFMAWREGKAQKASIACVELQAPADHVFCVVGDPSEITRLEGMKVKEMATSFSPGADLWIIDAWLNVLCSADAYPHAAYMKAVKWTRDGKRLAWLGADGKTPGWYPPTGDYGLCFLESKMAVTPATAVRK